MPNPASPNTASPARYGQAEWRALGTYVQLVVTGPAVGADQLEAARTLAGRLLDDVDRTCSRFREDSDLVRANRRAGSWTQVDPLLAAATGAAVWAARETGGLVDPTLGHSLAAAGYDRDYDAVRLDDGPAAIPVPAIIGAWQEVRADPAGAVLVPAGTALDLGATGKAFAADLIAAAISAHTGAGCVLSLGGDVAVGRADATGDGAGDGAGDTVPWRVAIAETPQDPPAAMVTLASGGLATSTTLTRRWHRGGQVVHHLLDPATGRSVEALWRTVSVAGPTCLEANTASTAAVVIGARATEWLAARGVAARLVDAEGAVTYAGGWTEEAM